MEDDAIVLDSIDSGESDLIVTLFCKHSGRLSAIAKGARRSKKRFVNKLEIFTLLNIDFTSKNKGLAFLREAELYTIFPLLRQNYPTYLAASVIREFLLYGIKEGDADRTLFDLTVWSLNRLNQQSSPDTTVLFFLLRFFECIGYRPELTHCINCGRPVTQDLRYTFVNNIGGLICSQCNSYRKTIGLGSIRTLQAAQQMPLNRLLSLHPTRPSKIEGLLLLHSFGRHLLQRDINSWNNFMTTVQKN